MAREEPPDDLGQYPYADALVGADAEVPADTLGELLDDGLDVLLGLARGGALGGDVQVVEAVERHAQLGDELEGGLGLQPGPGQHPRRAVDPGDVEPGLDQGDRHPPGPAAKLENRPAGLLGQRPEEGNVVPAGDVGVQLVVDGDMQSVGRVEPSRALCHDRRIGRVRHVGPPEPFSPTSPSGTAWTSHPAASSRARVTGLPSATITTPGRTASTLQPSVGYSSSGTSTNRMPNERISSHSPIGAGWEYLFVAIDDHARIGFTDMYPDEAKASAVQFLQNTVAYFSSLGVRPKRILTDNGSAFRSTDFAIACRALKLKHCFTRPYRPQTNGKAERFIQSALREWAYGIPYNHSSERTAMLERWMHHYNWHRPHQGIKGSAPISRLAQSENNLLTLHS